MTRYRTRIVAALVLAGLLSAGIALAKSATPPTGQVVSLGVQPTIPPPPTVTAIPATSSTLQAPGATTRDPDTFTTSPIPGPIQVRVPGESPCVGLAGEGYRVTWRISNAGPTVSGPVTAQLDLQPPIQVQPTLTLGRGQTREATAMVPGSGELVTVSWAGRTSFPMEVENCRTNPADERAARQLTTTTGTP
jgi:hypothetical protein